MLPSLHQGDEDGLCGLYAVVNAVTWLFADKMTAILEGHLFRHLLGSLEARGLEKTVAEGTESPEMRVMLDAAQKWLKPLGGQLEWHDRFTATTVKGFFIKASAVIKPLQAVAIIGLLPEWDHWTVATRASGSSLEIRDSVPPPDTITEIPLSNSGFSGATADFLIDPSCTFIVSRVR